MIEFSSDQAAPILMLDSAAYWVLEVFGASKNLPTAFVAEDVPDLLDKLQQAFKALQIKEKNANKLEDKMDALEEEDEKEAVPLDEVLLSHRIFLFLEWFSLVAAKNGYLVCKQL